MTGLVDAGGSPVVRQLNMGDAVQAREVADTTRNRALESIDARLAWIVELLRLRCEIDLASEFRKTAMSKGFENARPHVKLLRALATRLKQLEDINGENESAASQDSGSDRDDGGEGNGAPIRGDVISESGETLLRTAGDGNMGGGDER